MKQAETNPRRVERNETAWQLLCDKQRICSNQTQGSDRHTNRLLTACNANTALFPTRALGIDRVQ